MVIEVKIIDVRLDLINIHFDSVQGRLYGLKAGWRKNRSFQARDKGDIKWVFSYGVETLSLYL